MTDYLKMYQDAHGDTDELEPISNLRMEKIDLGRLPELAEALSEQFPELITSDTRGNAEKLALVTRPGAPKGNIAVWKSGKVRLTGTLMELKFDFYPVTIAPVVEPAVE